VRENTIMSIAYASEMIEIVSESEVLTHEQLLRHIEILHDIIASYTFPSFEDMLDWHKHLMVGENFAGKVRNFPAGRYTSKGYEPYPTHSKDSIKRKFDVFNKVNKHTLMSIAEFHIQITESHPFLDGNGRIARLILNAHLHVSGFGMCLIDRDNKNDYLTCLENKNTKALAKFIEKYLVM